MILENLHAEHGYMNRLLKVLQQKLTRVKKGQPVDYSLIKDIVDYLHNYAKCCHHPKEDILYRYYQSHYAKNDNMQSLELEHQELTQLTREFAESVDMILMDAVIPLDVFAEKLNTFVTRQKSHLEFEEKHIFPLIQRHFTAHDWLAVSAEYQGVCSDPLFGDKVSERYLKLSKRLSVS